MNKVMEGALKKIIILALLLFLSLPSISFAGQRWVRPHLRRDGGYVSGHVRTTPNRFRTDNYSYPGNYNPNTGRINQWSNSPSKTYPINPNPYDSNRKYRHYGW
jgi:hypothetical protein